MSDNIDENAVIEQALAEMHTLKASIKADQERVDELAAFFKNYEQFAEPNRYRIGEYDLVVSPNTRIDDALAKDLLSANKYRNVTKTVIDSAKAKRLLTGAEYESIQKKFAHRIGVEKH